ncbi:hypothetical protein HY485_00745, partial [Candidatus Woesearchaeota archaeon]|nr:hypothetical protein [Candidatus Woesearchaeota archaeon]
MLKRALEQPELFAEFAGILLGDGSLSRYECKSRQGIKIQSRLKVTLDSRETDYAKYVQELLTKLFEVKSLVRFK